MLYILGCIALALVSLAVLPAAIRGGRESGAFTAVKAGIGCLVVVAVVLVIIGVMFWVGATAFSDAQTWADAHPREASNRAIGVGFTFVAAAAIGVLALAAKKRDPPAQPSDLAMRGERPPGETPYVDKLARLAHDDGNAIPPVPLD